MDLAQIQAGAGLGGGPFALLSFFQADSPNSVADQVRDEKGWKKDF